MRKREIGRVNEREIERMSEIERETGSVNEREIERLNTNGVILLEELSCLFFSFASNFSNHNNTLGTWILEEHVQAINEVGSVVRISSDSDAQRLTETHLVGGFGDNVDNCNYSNEHIIM